VILGVFCNLFLLYFNSSSLLVFKNIECKKTHGMNNIKNVENSVPFPTGSSDSSLLPSAQTYPGAQPATYLIRNVGLLRE
jgi:hypothetical protein